MMVQVESKQLSGSTWYGDLHNAQSWYYRLEQLVTLLMLCSCIQPIERETVLPNTAPETMEQKGTEQMPQPVFTKAEQKKLEQLIQAIPPETAVAFESRYLEWKVTWDKPALQLFSDPRMYAQSDAYRHLLDFCKAEGTIVWPLLFVRFVQGDELAILLIEDCTFADYGHLMETIQQQSESKPGVVSSQSTNWLRYIQRVLAEL